MYIGQSWGTTSREPTCGGCKIKQHCADGDDSRRRSCRIKKGSCGKLPKLGRCYYQTSRTTNRGGWSARTWFPHMPRSTHRGQEVTSRKSISEGWRWGLYHSAIWIIGHPGSDKRNNHAYSKKRLKVTKKNKVVRDRNDQPLAMARFNWNSSENMELSNLWNSCQRIKTVPSRGTPL